MTTHLSEFIPPNQTLTLCTRSHKISFILPKCSSIVFCIKIVISHYNNTVYSTTFTNSQGSRGAPKEKLNAVFVEFYIKLLNIGEIFEGTVMSLVFYPLTVLIFFDTAKISKLICLACQNVCNWIWLVLFKCFFEEAELMSNTKKYISSKNHIIT